MSHPIEPLNKPGLELAQGVLEVVTAAHEMIAGQRANNPMSARVFSYRVQKVLEQQREQAVKNYKETL